MSRPARSAAALPPPPRRWSIPPGAVAALVGCVALVLLFSELVTWTAVVVTAGVTALMLGRSQTAEIRRWADLVFYGFFALFVLAALGFLGGAFLGFLAREVADVRDWLTRTALGESPIAGLARRAVVNRDPQELFEEFAGIRTVSPLQVSLEYAFSLFNLGLAVLVVGLRPRATTARLLALGLVGTAAVFNVQAHAGFAITPNLALFAHDWFHVVGGTAYLFAVLLFPDGHLVPPWPQLGPARRVLRVLGVVVVPLAAIVFVGLFHGGDPAGYVIIFGALIPVAGFVSQVGRLRHAVSAEERQQSRLLLTTLTAAVGGAATFGVLAALLGIGGTGANEGLRILVFRVFPGLFAVIPLLLVVILVRYRLWDVHRFLNRAFVYGSLASFIGVVYVAVVVAGSAQLADPGSATLPLSVLATVIVAVTFQPLRERVQQLANRLVYGQRETPYQVLATFSDRVAGNYAMEEVLPRMARVLAEGTNAATAEVWMVIGDALVRVAAWPEVALDAPDRLPVAVADVADVSGADRSVPVRLQGELLGAVSVTKPPGEELTPAEDRLLRDLAAQAGLVLRNARLTEELRASLTDIARQAEALRASRQRIVAAQDAERRRMERDIHDGAQQHLVALAVKLRLARSLVDRDPDRARPLLDELQEETGEALETLRNLARGIYPALLSDRGLPEALQAQARRATLPVEVIADGVGRYPQDVEITVYFCCLEALQNISKYAQASRVTIELRDLGEALEFTVTDDGVGFDTTVTPTGHGLFNLADRLAALDADLRVDSEPGAGTTVHGRVPLRTPAVVP